MELHTKIPADRWCITRREFFAFVHDVRILWRRGALPDSDEQPNDKHHHPRYGPNLYQVNAHYVKPVTLAAGGMSYALMKHPEGLRCQVFVSHAWAEGVFELSDHVKRAWPRGLGLQNIYCCLLANPQNLDIQSLLNVPPVHSPFAKAMQCASHVLVIPNDTVSIYTRLWCVYEIYLATQWKKTCVIPAKPQASTLRSMVTWNVLLPGVSGVLLGCAWAAAVATASEVSTHVWVVDGLLAGAIGLLVCSLGVETLMCTGQSCGASRIRRALRALQVGIQFVVATCAIPYFVLPCGRPGAYAQALHYGIPLGLWFTSIGVTMNHTGAELEQNELRDQANRLSFCGLGGASCSNGLDEARLRSAIADFEEDVVMSIQVLKSAGAYNSSLKRAHTRGLDIRGCGNANIDIRLSVGLLAWGICVIDELASAHIWEDCGHPAEDWIYASALVIAASRAAMVAASAFWLGHGPDKVNLVICVYSNLGMLANFQLFLVALLQGWAEVLRLPLPVRLSHGARSTPNADCPSLVTWGTAVPMRAAMAVLSAVVAWLVPACLACSRASGGDPEPKDGGDEEDPEGASATASDSSDSSD